MTLKVSWRLAWGILTLALALYAVGVTNAYRNSKAAHTRAEEALALAEASIAAAEVVPDLRDTVEKMLGDYATLKAQYDALKKATPSSTPEMTIENEGPVVTVEIPRVAVPSPATDGPVTVAECPEIGPSLFRFRVWNGVIVSESEAGTISVIGETRAINEDTGEEFASWEWDADNTTVTVSRPPKLAYKRHTWGIRPPSQWRTGWTVGVGIGRTTSGYEPMVGVLWGAQF